LEAPLSGGAAVALGRRQLHRLRMHAEDLILRFQTLVALISSTDESEVEGRFYSVPYRFARSEVEVRLTGRTVEIFVKGERIAVHMRSSGNGKHTTAADHMPSSHRRYADWTIGRIRRDAALIGPATAALCDLILEQRPHPEQGFRSCLGILRLARPFGVARLEAAATRAIEIGALTYGSVRSILDHKLDRHAAHQRAADGTPILHSNIRGSRYYQ
jgi:transposase